ncbi:TetR/AcrR family transcriptional regulator [Pendulispora brunnea]|uniref:TetR/AcrR family transcriptional regulator n=1 Tax=Pendulispora brunnea TaxID=2905690 RepID=A0ABZ2KHX1_9BACT
MVSRVDAEDDVRSRVLAAATRLFANRGFDGTSVQLIADEVGVTKPAVLHHFSSKEELRRAVVGNMLDHWQKTLPNLLLAATAGDDRFERVIGELLRFFTADPDRARLVAREMLDRPAEIRTLLKSAVRPWLAAVSGYIERGKNSGETSTSVDAEAYVIHILLLVIGASASQAVALAALDGKDAKLRYERELLRIARSSLGIQKGRRG